MEFLKKNWVGILIGLIMTALGAFGVGQFIRGNQEEARRIESQNEIARMSDVIEERNGVWSRLSQQQDDIINRLRDQNSGLADLIEQRNEQILTLSETVARIRDVHVVVRPRNITQTPVGDDRIRVDFHEEVDPIRVEGFTLTNPGEADLTVGFTRPLRLTTTVTQAEDGSWKTYVEGDWPNLEIEQIDSVVNPQPIRERTFVENLIVGGDLATSFQFDSIFADVYMMYEFNESLAVGPSIGAAVIGDQARATIGLKFQWAPWRQ